MGFPDAGYAYGEGDADRRRHCRKGTIIPNAVGSDIGCGMIFVPMNVQLAQIQGIMTGNGSLIQLLVGDILRNIPTGINRYKMPQESAVLDRAKEQMELYEQNPELTGLIADGYYQTGRWEAAIISLNFRWMKRAIWR